jgi:hypothetical protein
LLTPNSLLRGAGWETYLGMKGWSSLFSS